MNRKVKIVVLDGYCVNSGDLNWDVLSTLGEMVVYDNTPYDLITERAKDADIIITNKCNIDSKVIDNLPMLKYVGELATGYNNIDIKYARKKGVVVTNVPAYSTESVVQTIVGLIISLALKLPRHFERVKQGDWVTCPNFCFYEPGILELYGKTLGIVGFGRIGMRLKEIANAFGMKVVVFSNSMHKKEDGTFRYVSLDELLSISDVVSLNCPLTDKNKGFIDKNKLSLMKKSAFLINTARGPLVNEADLAYALNEGIIAGAGVDVLSEEPAKADNPLFAAKNILITPHLAWATYEARSRLLGVACDNIKAFLNGESLNVVN
ncbi:MAG: D-2-hydroxyacid dehydrogenase [Christensenellales bacterium]|jgi:glycerate dehydrogenase|nr:D-2-hydroxyacid dehydrogenase [Clostridiales bacterium]